MTATYSSFDTLTINQYGAPSASPDGRLPVLAEIPTIGSAPVASPQPAPVQPAEPEWTPAQVAPPTVRRHEPHAPAPAVEPAPATPEPVEDPREPFRPQYEQEPWTTRLLEIEAVVRPHARLIVLVTLIVLTGMTLALIQAPVPEPPQAPPSEVVDAPSPTPSLSKPQEAQLVSADPEQPLQELSRELDPIPVLPQADTMPRAQITAVGPSSRPSVDSYANRPADDITPLGPSIPSDTMATSAGPKQLPDTEVRVADRSLYPMTYAPNESWRPAADAATQPSQVPVARLQAPANP